MCPVCGFTSLHRSYLHPAFEPVIEWNLLRGLLSHSPLFLSFSLVHTHVAMSKYLDVHNIFTTSKLHYKNESFCNICLLLMLPRLKC